jgi:hypothetical protein
MHGTFGTSDTPRSDDHLISLETDTIGGYPVVLILGIEGFDPGVETHPQA